MIVLFWVAEILSVDKKFLSSCIVWLAWAHQARLAILHQLFDPLVHPRLVECITDLLKYDLVV